MRTIPTPPRALLLAGGEGRRLRLLTRQISDDARPMWLGRVELASAG